MANITDAINEFKTAPNGESVRSAFVEVMTRVNDDNIKIGSDYVQVIEAAGQVGSAVSSASASAALAASKATEASNAVSVASGHATTATTKAGKAATSASTATAASNIASNKAGEATTAATNAINAKNISVTKAGEAATSATTATNAASTISAQITTASDSAEASALAAATSATSASNSASTATTKANEISTAHTTITTKLADTIAARDIAVTKAGEATTAAATSVSIRDELSPHLTTIDQKVTNATDAATLAVSSKDVAVTKAGEAAISATSVSEQSTIATTAATTATTKASEASASATAAEQFAANAEAAVGVTAEERNTWNGKQDALGFVPENSTQKGTPSGYASLDASGKVPSSQLPVIAEHTHTNKDILDKITVGTAVSYDLDSFGDMKTSVYDTTQNGIVDNAEKVNGLTVETAVPINAVFTDTVYTPPSTYSADVITDGATNKVFTSTLKTKLDSVEEGATADQTASELLDAIKTVDGSTSGLDADLLDGKHADEFALSSHGTHVTYADTTTALVSGGTGVVGTSGDLARADHTHSLPVYPDLAGHVAAEGVHTTTEKQTEWNKNTTDIVLLQQQSGTLGANDAAVRREVLDIKLKLDEMNVVEYLNKTGIGFFDLFEDSTNIDTANTTAVMTSTDVTFTDTQVLQMKSQNFSDFTNVELAVYDLLREKFMVTVAVSNSPTISMNITPGSRTIGEKFYHNGEVYTITNVVAS